MLNFNKVKNYIIDKLENEYKRYYPEVITSDLKVSVNSGSFGACLISIEKQGESKHDFYNLHFEYVANYSDIDKKISDFVIRNYERLAEQVYRQYKNQSTTEMLYNSKLKYNCSYYEMKHKYRSDLLILFLGTSDFIITNNFFGVVAYGKRNFDFDNTKAIYTYKQIENSISKSDLVAIMKKYEKTRLKINNIEVKESE